MLHYLCYMAAIIMSVGPSLALDNGIERPAMGWSSWNHFGKDVTDALLREVADAMVTSGRIASNV